MLLLRVPPSPHPSCRGWSAPLTSVPLRGSLISASSEEPLSVGFSPPPVCTSHLGAVVAERGREGRTEAGHEVSMPWSMMPFSSSLHSRHFTFTLLRGFTSALCVCDKHRVQLSGDTGGRLHSTAEIVLGQICYRIAAGQEACLGSAPPQPHLGTVVLKDWSWDQQHWHHLGTCERGKLQDLAPNLLYQKLLGWGPAPCV